MGLHLRDINNVIINIGATCKDKLNNIYLFDWSKEDKNWIAYNDLREKVRFTQEDVYKREMILIKKL